MMPTVAALGHGVCLAIGVRMRGITSLPQSFSNSNNCVGQRLRRLPLVAKNGTGCTIRCHANPFATRRKLVLSNFSMTRKRFTAFGLGIVGGCGASVP